MSVTRKSVHVCTNDNIKDCIEDNIYSYCSFGRIYILKYDNHTKVWYFSTINATNLHHTFFESRSFHDVIREACEVEYEVRCFTNELLFAKWVVENAY